MDKFKCTCGMSYETEYQANLHKNLNDEIYHDDLNHQISKMTKIDIFKRFILHYLRFSQLRVLGMWIIFSVLRLHFNIEISIYELILIGIGMELIS
jgi:hypothetical protein